MAAPNDSIFNELKEIIVEQLAVDPEEVTIEASFVEDLNADSLDLVELIMEIEEKFGIQVPDEVAEKIVTVNDAVEYIQEQRS
ncbi:MAG: acpP [Chloroflexi bacterium]|jgi:acyl carrier protein|nr:acpP [Chloroflexota bacterium]